MTLYNSEPKMKIRYMDEHDVATCLDSTFVQQASDMAALAKKYSVTKIRIKMSRRPMTRTEVYDRSGKIVKCQL